MRRPDTLVARIDRHVEREEARSRAEVVAHALQRERRRVIATRDAAIFAGTLQTDGLDDLARYAASVPLDDPD